MTQTNNVIELTSARSRLRAKGPMRSASDKRSHKRVDCDDRLFVQVVLAADEPDLVGTTLSCNAVNLSIGGIQFRTDSHIPPGSLLDLWVDISSRPGKFFLAGEVRWSRSTGQVDAFGNDEYFVGVQLKAGAATDILDWRDFHAQVTAR